MKSVDAVPSRLEKLVTSAGTNIQFQIKLHAIHFLLMFNYCKNHSLEIKKRLLKNRELLFNHPVYIP